MTSGHGSIEAIRESMGPEAAQAAPDKPKVKQEIGLFEGAVIGGVLVASTVYTATRFGEAALTFLSQKFLDVGYPHKQ